MNVESNTMTRSWGPIPVVWTVVVLILPCISLSPMLAMQWRRLLDQNHMQFFPIALGFALWTIFNERMSVPSTPGRQWLAQLLTILAMLFSLISVFLFSFGGVQFSLSCLFISWAVGVYGNVSLSRLISIGFLFLVTIPLPGGMDKGLIQSLQSASTSASSAVLDALKIVHVADGNVIRLPERALFVEEACSGIDSLYALFAVGLIMIVYLRRTLLSALVTLAWVVVWAFLGNLIRLSTISVSLSTFGVDFSTGMPHTILGMCVFVLVATMLVLTDRSCSMLLAFPESKRKSQSALQVSNGKNVPVRELGVKPSLLHYVLSVLVLCLCPISVMAILRSGDSFLKTQSMSEETANLMPGESFFSNSSSIVRSSFRKEKREEVSLFGKYSHAWTFGKSEEMTLLSFDFPFYGWHDLGVCYSSAGWTVSKAPTLVRTFENGDVAYVHGFDLRNKYGTRSRVCYTLFDSRGNSLGGPELVSTLYSRNVLALAGLTYNSKSFETTKQVFQVQVVREQASEIDSKQQESMEDLLVMAAGRIRESTIKVLSGELSKVSLRFN